VAPDGRTRHLAGPDLLVEATRHWQSPRSGGRYPAGWRLQAPGPGLSLEILPVVDDQEMRTPGSTGVVYWEGLVEAAGRRDGRPVSGHGYVELTGYAGAFDAPL
jgi:predicted secreted hydrolase